MSDLNEWLKQRRTIHAKATEGPWETNDWGDLTAGSDLLLVGTATSEGNFADPDDAIATVDAHNMFPRALNALEQVLELHTFDHEHVACGNPQHTNFEVGCPDCYLTCPACGEPCPCLTVQAIEGAINE